MGSEEIPTGETAILPLSEEEFKDHMLEMPASVLLHRALGVPHDHISGLPMEKLQIDLQKTSGLSDRKLQKVLIGAKQPENLEQEELLHLLNLRGAIQVLVMRLISLPFLPDEIKDKLRKNAFENVTNNEKNTSTRNDILWDLYHWREKHHEEDKLPSDNIELINQLGSMYERMEVLLTFYRDKRSLQPGGVSEEDFRQVSSNDKERYMLMSSLRYNFFTKQP